MSMPRLAPHALFFSFFVLLTPLLGACNPNGYADLWEASDIAIECEGTTTTWIRTYYEPAMPVGTDEEQELALRTEFMIVRSEIDALTGAPTFTETGCMNLAKIHRDGTLDLLEGSFLADGQGGGIWEVPQMYEFVHEAGVRILNRRGSETFQLDPREIYDVEIRSTVSGLTLSLDGSERHYQNLMDVLSGIDRTSVAGATVMGQVLNVGLLVSQVRVRGFGGAGMTEYIQTPKDFRGLVSGVINVSGVIGAGNVKMTVDYQGFSDFTGMSLTGPQIGDVSWAGDGHMRGFSDFVIQLDPLDPSDTLVGHFDYEGATIRDGFGQGGYGTMTLNGMDFPVPVDEALVTDLRSILPLD